MYYEEKVIDNKLMYRTKPNGEWIECHSAKALIVNLLCKEDEETRLNIFALFT